MADQHDDVLLHFAAEHPFDHFHGLFVRDPHALHESAELADFFEDLGHVFVPQSQLPEASSAVRWQYSPLS